jgi:hypothetical protein
MNCPEQDRSLLHALQPWFLGVLWQWIINLPEQRSGGSYTLQICSSSPPTNQSLKLVIGRQSDTRPRSLSFSICAEFGDPISLWSANYSRTRLASTTDHLLHVIICGVFQYGSYSNHRSFFRLLNVEISEDSSSKIFNVAALTLAILVCI